MNHIKSLISAVFVVFLLASCNNSSPQQNSQAPSDSTSQDTAKTESSKRILFFGNSLTAGLGLDDQTEAFPALIQAKIDSLGLGYTCINAGLSGETSAGGKDRIDWLLKDKIDVFVLELGANDGLRGISPDATYQNLNEIVNKVKKAYPDCKLVLTGMMVPPSMGDQYFKDFAAIFPKLAKEQNMTLVPFLLDKVAGIQSLNQGDGVHPTKEGQQILAENVWTHLKTIL
ncbi:arylesterase [Sphingobacterium mizutaii NBRC 14946 = DSM 11724]|uniref:Esterase TesA n=2 Tax=Sphingobacterium mizutaii TaxID=1010 RepID=A0AAJ4X9Z7_9SPHI|nr:arylesterase [Sphingobacterium mizutaii]GEM68544.1 arylesterase [Sphingobacterium mizutaii NBRC 14946 = DSM 11724]SDK88761.1 acyl-CoA thioesterase-1 [Sphingobacterium mizutaii]SNV46669.1 Esterase TesA precursor [Sphingobacterium mizutaii]